MSNNLEECIKKVNIKKINGQEWMLLNKECPTCKYCDEIKIYYCRNRQTYLKYYQNKKQLILPFERWLIDEFNSQGHQRVEIQ
jgi:hypothetical protein